MKIVDIKKIKLSSVNKKYLVNPRSGRFILNHPYRAMKESIELCCAKVKLDPPYRVIIELECYLDIDNPIKCILDGIAKTISNDRDILELIIKKERTKRGASGSIKVFVETIGGCDE